MRPVALLADLFHPLFRQDFLVPAVIKPETLVSIESLFGEILFRVADIVDVELCGSSDGLYRAIVSVTAVVVIVITSVFQTALTDLGLEKLLRLLFVGHGRHLLLAELNHGLRLLQLALW